MAFLGPIPYIFVEAILTCFSATDLAPEIYNMIDPSFYKSSRLEYHKEKGVVSFLMIFCIFHFKGGIPQRRDCPSMKLMTSNCIFPRNRKRKVESRSSFPATPFG
ncbi:hypothetical protein LI410_mgp005 (mitochondrion) [Apium graveolens]|uniref:hypothetical protein n=1 Tax=Apium graveolens TaxID=4045 RepID=UPI001D003E0F|nr:hypothetical protein LI410_mgp118 [Apium graveolens]YP_010185221.1 hypothetical protein LI410_mgp005 [Apium graveolens]QVJ97866.1 hypothetical protein [Apium graveolens]QVJ97978.1 hypothetical protein [Apium graveolens]QVJ98122.1 hypothetical protein [Apium graveolens]